jgi:RNA polymerase sigma-70 factor, ECF subfamily
MDKAEEQTLVRRLSKFDEDAWVTFCTEFGTVLAERLRSQFGCDAHRAEEIVQMTFVRCIRSIRSFDPSRGRLLPWLKAVAANEARTYLQGQSPLRSGTSSAGSRLPLAAIVDCLDREPLPEDVLGRKEVQRMVADCLLELPLRQRAVLTMKYQEELKVAEIARRLNLSEKAVESLLSRSRESFRSVLVAKATAARLTPGDMEP